MDVNGESTAKRWQKAIHVRGLITVVPWPRVVPFANKYVYWLIQVLFLTIEIAYIKHKTR